MRKYLIYFGLLFSANSLAQVKNLQIHKDSIEVLEFLNLLSGKSKEVIGIDIYFVYKNKLYNNATSYHGNLPNTSYAEPLNKIATIIDTSQSYSDIIDGGKFKMITVDSLKKRYFNIFCNDTTVFKELKSPNVLIASKKVDVVFVTFECNIINENELAGWAVHNKIYERRFYKIWNGRYILPIR
jgi:hypothetical protein